MTQAFLEIIGSGTSESHGFLFQKRNRFGILSMPCWGVRFSNIESHGFVMFKWCIHQIKKNVLLFLMTIAMFWSIPTKALASFFHFLGSKIAKSFWAEIHARAGQGQRDRPAW